MTVTSCKKQPLNSLTTAGNSSSGAAGQYRPRFRSRAIVHLLLTYISYKSVLVQPDKAVPVPSFPGTHLHLCREAHRKWSPLRIQEPARFWLCCHRESRRKQALATKEEEVQVFTAPFMPAHQQAGKRPGQSVLSRAQRLAPT